MRSSETLRITAAVLLAGIGICGAGTGEMAKLVIPPTQTPADTDINIPLFNTGKFISLWNHSSDWTVPGTTTLEKSNVSGIMLGDYKAGTTNQAAINIHRSWWINTQTGGLNWMGITTIANIGPDTINAGCDTFTQKPECHTASSGSK